MRDLATLKREVTAYYAECRKVEEESEDGLIDLGAYPHMDFPHFGWAGGHLRCNFCDKAADAVYWIISDIERPFVAAGCSEHVNLDFYWIDADKILSDPLETARHITETKSPEWIQAFMDWLGYDGCRTVTRKLREGQ